MDNSILNSIRAMNNVRQFDEVMEQILSTDRHMAHLHIHRLHARCAAILDKENPVEAENHRLDSIAFLSDVTFPVRNKGDGTILISHYYVEGRVVPWNEFLAEAFEHYWIRANACLDPLVKAHYLCILWEARKAWSSFEKRVSFSVPEVARMLVKNCLLVAARETKSENELAGAGRVLTEYLEIAIYISCRFQEEDVFQPFLPDVLSFAERLFETAPQWSLGIAEVIAYLAKPGTKSWVSNPIDAVALERMRKLVEKVQEKYDLIPGHGGGPEAVLEVLTRIEKLLGREVTQQDYEKRLAEGYLKRAHQNMPNFVKATYFKDAAAHFHEAGMREAAADAKAQSRRAAQAASENNEYNTVTVSRTITKDRMDQMHLPFFKNATTAEQVLRRLSQSMFASMLERNVTSQGASAFVHLIPMVPIVDDRVKATQESVNGVNQYQIKQDWLREIQINSEVILSTIFQKLRDEFNLNSQSLYLVLTASTVWRSEDIPFVKCSIERFIEKDFVSYIHILVPRAEQFIRQYLMNAGADVTSYRDGDLREKPLGELLREADQNKFIPEALIRLLQAIFSEEWGMNLRNRVAHGLITESECSEATANRLIHTLILLNAMTYSS